MPYTYLITDLFNNAAHGKAAITAPAQFYMGLSTTTPSLSGGNVSEPSGNGYARVYLTGASFSSSVNGSITNTATITFPTATGNWGTVTHIVVADTATGGVMFWFAPITPTVVNTGVTLSLPPGTATSTIS